MKKLLTYSALGALMTFGSAVSARANTVQFLFTANNVIGATSFSGCGTSMATCGILGIGLTNVETNGGGSILVQSSTSGASATAINPTLSAGDAWGTYASFVTAPMANTSAIAGETSIAFITGDTTISTKGLSYQPLPNGTTAVPLAAANSTGISSNAGIIAGTTTFGFNVTSNSLLTVGTTYTITLETYTDFFNTDGSVGTKDGAGSITLNLVAQSVATPEPSSILLILSGIAAMFVVRKRYVRA